MSLERSRSKYDVVKIVLVGPSQSGKTALHGRLTRDQSEYKFPADYEETIGVDFRVKLYDKSQLKLQVWDTSGSPRYESVVSPYYKKAGTIVYTLNGSQPLQEQAEFLRRRKQSVEFQNPGAIPILVVTQSDQESQITAEELEQFCEEFGIDRARGNLVTGVSAKTGEGLEKVERVLRCKAKESLDPKPRQEEFGFYMEEKSEEEPQLDRASVEALFWEARDLVLHPDSPINVNPATEQSGDEFVKKLKLTREQTLADLDQGKITLIEAHQIANSTKILAGRVANLDDNLENHVSNFSEAVAPCVKTSLLGKVIGGLIGAVAGVIAGAMIGAAAGPGAALTALAGGLKGAVTGAALGGAAFGAAGAWFSMWREKRNHNLTNLRKAAEVVAKDHKASLG